MKKLGLVLALLFMGCRQFVLDPSPEAVAAQDLTLIISACENVPARGMDICRVKENAKIQSSWRLVLPVGGNFIGGELVVYYKDQSFTTAINEKVVEIPWSQLVKRDVWHLDDDGEALALATIRYKDDQGIEKIWKARGIAKLIVTKESYDPMPIDSEFYTWGTTCKIQYSTAGRSAIECK